MSTSSDDLQIVDYRPEMREHFEALNREWLEKYFEVEPVDLDYFADPEGGILDKGGEIYFAVLDGRVVGTCALLCEAAEDGEPPELGKMAVTKEAQGRGIGEKLARHAIERARKRGFDRLRLVTNTKLIPAIRLYEKLGFEETFRGQDPKYSRGDLVMERELGAT